jgi:hypothetical protein
MEFLVFDISGFNCTLNYISSFSMLLVCNFQKIFYCVTILCKSMHVACMPECGQ